MLVDTRCYSFNNANVTDDHMMIGGSKVAGCAAICAKMGIPVAVLEGDVQGGTLFTISAPAAVFAPYMGMQTRLTGKEVSPGMIFPASVEVKTASGWKKVKAKGML